MVTKTTNKKMYGNLIKAIVAIVVGIAVAAGMIACDNDNNKVQSVTCDCSDKAHLGDGENCACGGDACDCTEQKAVIAGTAIPITKQAGVTVAQMNDALPIINAAYGSYHNAGINGKVTAIHLTKTGKLYSYDNNFVISINIAEMSNFKGMLGAIVDGAINPGDVGPDVVAQL